MSSLRTVYTGAVLLLLGITSVPVVAAQANEPALATSSQNILIRSIRVIPEYEGCSLEIISDHPLVPAIAKLENPARIVIDLPNARLSSIKKRIAFRSTAVAGVRVGQFQDSVARIVIDLVQPLEYSWDAAGNRLMVRLHAADGTPKATSVPAFTPEAPPTVVPVSSNGPGAVFLAGSRLATGSSITAGSDTAVLNLGRGGEVRVCPGTTVSVTPSQNGRSLMLGMSTGAMEAHYALDASSDSILTPDFRILLAGPGEFHYAISADPRGNTCVQALPGNTASVILSEVLGDGTYQVTPAQQVMFRSGQLRTASSAIGSSCGCPEPEPNIMRTSLPARAPERTPTSSMELARSDYNGPDSSSPNSRSPETAALPPLKPDDVHVQVDVPFVFNANEAAGAASQTSFAPAPEAEMLPIRDLSPRPGWFQVAALPPVRAAHHGFFGKVRGFFSAIFG
ncbi:MAG TPA: AMIN domain-containing protein [Terriglobales bacterium]|nr:AMIN domain-containing protein [Terriglobales bacterium]